MLTLIVARARNGAIGKNNGIPWHAPEDLKMFQRETKGGAVIMGRLTWESLPVKPLKDRLNCVVSRDKSLTELVTDNPRAAIEACYARGYRRLYGIGGAAIYRELLPHSQRLLITEVALEIDEADAFFPEFATEDWVEIGAVILRNEAPVCRLRELLRRESKL